MSTLPVVTAGPLPLLSRRLAVAVAALALWAGCAAPPVGRGGPVYEVVVDSINGRPTGITGPASHPAATIQIGSEVRRVWLGRPDRTASPPLMRADAAALKDGIMIELDWKTAVLRRLTDEELAVGAAVVYIPQIPGPVVVELRFRPLPKVAVAPR